MRLITSAGIGLSAIAAMALPAIAGAQFKPDIDLKASYRSFAGGPEGGYGSAVLTIKPLGNTSYYIAGVSGPNGNDTAGAQTVFFGGKELELGFSSVDSTSHLIYGLGVAFPTTFTQTTQSLTYKLGYDFRLATNSLGAYIVGYSGTSLVALKVTDSFDLTDKLSAHLSAAVPLSGQSTVSINSANQIRVFVGEAELNYRVGDNAKIRLGITNALGETTRTSLSTPVGNHYGVLVGFGVKF